jgi:hypothetical protein
MNETDTSKQPATSQAQFAHDSRPSAWPAGVACLCFFALTVLLLQAYGLLHWRIIHHNYSSLQAPLKGDLFRLLGYLEIYHLTGLFSAAFGIWAFRGSPYWLRWVCLPLGLLSLGMSLIVM